MNAAVQVWELAQAHNRSACYTFGRGKSQRQVSRRAMFDAEDLREIERACRLRHPRAFRAAIGELSALVREPAFQTAFPGARLIGTLPEVLAARRDGVPDWLIPLMVVGRYPDIEWYVYHPEGCFLRWWRVGHDVTCFRHRDEVAGWRGLGRFIQWCRESCASVAVEVRGAVSPSCGRQPCSRCRFC